MPKWGHIGPKDVAKAYNRFRNLYFPGRNLPDFDDLDFEFAEIKDEWGHVEFDGDGLPHLSLDPVNRRYRPLMKETLLHEMIHLLLGPNRGHGKEFWEEVRRIMLAGAYKEFF